MSRRPLPAAEVLCAAFNVLFAAAWLFAAQRHDAAAWLAAAHAVAAALPFVLGPDLGRAHQLTGTLRDLYPLIAFALFWTELGMLHTGPLRTFDPEIAALDTMLFGAPLTARWIVAMPWLWLSEFMYAAYVAYYAAVVLPPLAFALLGKSAALRETVLRLLVTYLICFSIYAILPVLGPARTLPLYQGDLVHGFFYGISHTAHAAGDSAGTAFPSSHVAGCIAVAWIAWRRCPRWLAWLLSFEALAVAAATIYTQNHYPLDVVAGAAVAVLAQAVIVPALVRRRAPHPALRPAFTPAPSSLP